MKERLFILNLEDSRTDAESIREKLDEEGVACQIQRVESREDFTEALDRVDLDLVLADYSLLGFDGLSALALAREMRPDTPFIFVSKNMDEDIELEALKAGATDYVLKTRLFRLAPAIRRAMREAEDRTECKRVEAALRQAQERTESILASVADVHFILDREGRYLYVNQAAIQAMGHPREQILGRTFWELYPAVAGTEIDRQYHRAMDERLPIVFEFYYPPTDKWWVTRYYPVPEGVACFSTNITERKRAEEALRLENERFTRFFESNIVGFVIGDFSGKVLLANDYYLNILGVSRQDFLSGKVNWKEFTPPEWMPVTEKAMRELRERGICEPFEKEYVRADGTRVAVYIADTLLSGPEKNVAGIVLDITDRKKLEDQLRQAQKMEAIGQLAGGIAHDFNNILSAIMGYGALLRKKLGNHLKADLDEILGAAERAAILTHSLLAFSRKQILNPKPTNLHDILRRVGMLLGRIIGEHIELTTTLRNGELIAVVDSGQIEQVLMNLATNARDAMPGGGSLIISAEPVTMDGRFIRANGYGKPGTYGLISVIDTGMGMDDLTRSRIFEPFFTTKEQGKGTGLGLSMVHGIVKQHNGYIKVFSEPGKGTTIKIYLPLIEATVKEERKAVSLPPPRRGRETILVAEDDAALRGLAEIVLKEYGYTVLLAEDGEVAVRKFREHKEEIQLVFLDMIMPKMSGKDAYEELRKIKPTIKAIFSTGYTADKFLEEADLRTAVDFILKPMSPLELIRKVREVLDR